MFCTPFRVSNRVLHTSQTKYPFSVFCTLLRLSILVLNTAQGEFMHQNFLINPMNFLIDLFLTFLSIDISFIHVHVLGGGRRSNALVLSVPG